MALIFEPDTPGGLRLSIDCKMASSSATAEDMMVMMTTMTMDAEALQ